MHIVCPHCTTSYAIDPATLGAAGRNVRCSRCKEVWLARPEDATEMASASSAMAGAGQAANTDAASEWEAMAREDDGAGQDTPVVDSPSISADWPAASQADSDWAAMARSDEQDGEAERPRRLARLRQMFRLPALKPSAWLPGSDRSFGGLPTACAAMGALVLALVIWRVDVVRLLPQTASFYKMVGLEVNLRGLVFKDVKISTETVEGKPVLVIEGAITGEASKPVELPRLRFSVRDAQGAEIYAWNAVLQQPVLKPGETAWFKSRLASPPPEGRNIDVRFFSKRDIASGNI
jgi:predicted Zn finger-like uncharacterized protein